MQQLTFCNPPITQSICTQGGSSHLMMLSLSVEPHAKSVSARQLISNPHEQGLAELFSRSSKLPTGQ